MDAGASSARTFPEGGEVARPNLSSRQYPEHQPEAEVQDLESELFVTLGAACDDNAPRVRLGEERINKQGKVLRPILPVAVHGDDQITTRYSDATRKPTTMARWWPRLNGGTTTETSAWRWRSATSGSRPAESSTTQNCMGGRPSSARHALRGSRSSRHSAGAASPHGIVPARCACLMARSRRLSCEEIISNESESR